MNISFKQLVMIFQLIAAVTAGAVGIFKGKEMLHDYLTQHVPVIALHGQIKQKVSGNGRAIVSRLLVMKTRPCRLLDAGRLSATIQQKSLKLNRFVFLEPVTRIRPREHAQIKRITFSLPEGYNNSKEGLLILDLQYSCKDGNEAVYLDIPIRALTNSERSHMLIMRQTRKLNKSGE